MNRDTLISAEENRDMFDAIAKRYDLMNRLISLGLDKRWRRRALAMLEPVPDGRYLDIGCGTGDLCVELATCESQALVTGLDPSREMMAIAETKVRKHNLQERVAFRVGDAMALPFDDNQFEGVILGFCIRNVENVEQALREIVRVLKPAGRLVILELATPQNRAVAWMHRVYTSVCIPLVARVLTLSSAYAYLVKSVRAFPDRFEFEKKMKKAGFTKTRARPLTLGTVTLFSGEKERTGG